MEQIHNPLNPMTKSVGATARPGGRVVVARAGNAAAWTTGRDKPVPYDRCSAHVPGSVSVMETSTKKNLQLVELHDKPAGAAISRQLGRVVVARIGQGGSLDNGTGQARPLRPVVPGASSRRFRGRQLT